MKYKLIKKSYFVYLSGKPGIPYGLRPDSYGVLVIKGSQQATTASSLMP